MFQVMCMILPGFCCMTTLTSCKKKSQFSALTHKGETINTHSSYVIKQIHFPRVEKLIYIFSFLSIFRKFGDLKTKKPS